MEPVILQGQFRNSPVNELTVFIKNIPGIYSYDTIRLNDDGTFYLKTYKISEPHEIAIQGHGFYLNSLYVAPGFDLTLTCDGTDWKSTRQTLEIEGIGKESNAFVAGFSYYESVLDSREPIKKRFLQSLDRLSEIDDSIYQVHYINNKSTEPYFDYFSEVIKLDIQFDKLRQLIQYARSQINSPKEIERFVRGNFDNQTLDNISNDAWLISASYQNLVKGLFSQYQMIVERKYDPQKLKDDAYVFENLARLYRSKTREFVFSGSIIKRFRNAKDLEELELKAKTLEPFIQSFQNESYVRYLEQQYRSKELKLLESQVGNPAPHFSLPDSTGFIHSLQDFYGKVVFMDLWASWCKPCREETPILKEIYQEFQNRRDIVFIGIAIRDFQEDWIKAIKEDKPVGLQLIDKDQIVSRTYHANVLPRYIIIDKYGKFADADAPRPSEREELINILYKEINRD